jgi:hypothetical protein
MWYCDKCKIVTRHDKAKIIRALKSAAKKHKDAMLEQLGAWGELEFQEYEHLAGKTIDDEIIEAYFEAKAEIDPDQYEPVLAGLHDRYQIYRKGHPAA